MVNEWSRDIPWRQGLLVANDLFSESENSLSEDDLVIVISHDCDIACNITTEPNVEYIIGKKINGTNGSFLYAKNPRKLHISMISSDQQVMDIELLATGKRQIPKERLIGQEPLDWHFSDNDFLIFQRWLAARYRRAAFPDDFDKVLDNPKHRLREKMMKILTSVGSSILTVYARVEMTDMDEPYKLDMILIHPEGMINLPGSKQAIDHLSVVEPASKRIVKLFEDALMDEDSGEWKGIELLSCIPVSQNVFSIGDAQQMKEWRVEQISLANLDHPIQEH